MMLLSKIFFSFSIIFIFVEFFQMFKRKELYQKLSDVELNDTLPFFVFYLLRLLYLPWMYIGLFSGVWYLFLSLISLGAIKFSILYLKKDFILNLFDLIDLTLSCWILIFIFLQVFSQ